MGRAAWASPEVLAGPVTGAQLAPRIGAVVAGPEGFARGGRIVMTVSFGPKVYESFFAVLAGFDHFLFARACAGPRTIARHAGFS